MLAGPGPREVAPALLTRDECSDLQLSLIAAYGDSSFQQELHDVFAEAGADLEAACWARTRLCLPIQEPIIRQYGFDPTMEGIMRQWHLRAIAPELRGDEELRLQRLVMNWLLYPPLQMHSLPPPDFEKVWKVKGAVWLVVGGATTCGLRVREGLATNSLECNGRVAHGAFLRQLVLVNGRLFFKKLAGSGPEYGWVSLFSNGRRLVKPLDAAGGAAWPPAPAAVR